MKVNLKIKEGNAIKTEQHEIEPLSLSQLNQSLKVIKDIAKAIREDEHLKKAFEELFDNTAADQTAGVRIVDSVIGALDTLLVELPEKAFELLAILAGIDYEVFMSQKAEDAFDIYDAIIQTIDVEKLINRGKKSFELTRKFVDFKKIFQNPEQTEQKQA